MSGLRDALNEYLGLRRSLGFKLRQATASLRNFVSFAETEAASHITVALVLRWLERSQAQPATKADRFAMVRRFALWHSTSDPRTEVPPEGLLPHRYRRKPPYIYTDDEVEGLVEAAVRLPSPKGLRGLTYSTFFGLVAVTGLRMSEGVALDRDDVDLDDGILTIRGTKFGKTRLVPVHPSTREALQGYAEQKDRIIPRSTSSAFCRSPPRRTSIRSLKASQFSGFPSGSRTLRPKLSSRAPGIRVSRPPTRVNRRDSSASRPVTRSPDTRTA